MIDPQVLGGPVATGLLQVIATEYLVELGPVRATPTDYLRLLVVPVFGWTAYRDVRTRRVPNRTWVPLAVLALALLVGDGWMAANSSVLGLERLALEVALSVGIVVPLAYVFWRIGGFGGADAKALMVLALLVPRYPAYLFGQPLAAYAGSIPVEATPVGVFSFSVLTNAVIVGVVYPLGVTARNLLAGRVSPVMFVGRPIPVERLPETYGRLLEDAGGTTRRGLDLDALRMYLRWRGITLAQLREDPEQYRDPGTVPEDPRDPGDGAITDGGEPVDDRPEDATAGGGVVGDGSPGDGGGSDDGPADDRADDPVATEPDPAAEPTATDQWGAEAFLEDAGGAYGTTAEELREGLEVVVESEDVWVSPGLPFLVPLFLGLVTTFVYGDVMFGLMELVGLV